MHSDNIQLYASLLRDLETHTGKEGEELIALIVSNFKPEQVGFEMIECAEGSTMDELWSIAESLAPPEATHYTEGKFHRKEGRVEVYYILALPMHHRTMMPWWRELNREVG